MTALSKLITEGTFMVNFEEIIPETGNNGLEDRQR